MNKQAGLAVIEAALTDDEGGMELALMRMTMKDINALLRALHAVQAKAFYELAKRREPDV